MQRCWTSTIVSSSQRPKTQFNIVEIKFPLNHSRSHECAATHAQVGKIQSVRFHIHNTTQRSAALISIFQESINCFHLMPEGIWRANGLCSFPSTKFDSQRHLVRPKLVQQDQWQSEAWQGNPMSCTQQDVDARACVAATVTRGGQSNSAFSDAECECTSTERKHNSQSSP